MTDQSESAANSATSLKDKVVSRTEQRYPTSSSSPASVPSVSSPQNVITINNGSAQAGTSVLWAAVVLVLGLGFLSVLFFHPLGGNSFSTVSQERTVASAQATAQQPVTQLATVQSTQDDPPGASAKGVQSWTEYQATATPANYAALKAKWGYTKQDVAYFVSNERRFGKNYSDKLPVGTSISNTGFKGSGWYPVSGYRIKNGDVLVLVDDQGHAVVKQSCANPIRVETGSTPRVAQSPKPREKPKEKPREKPKEKPKPKPTTVPCPPANSGPGTTPFKDSPGAQPPSAGGNAGPTTGAGPGTNQGNPGAGTGSTKVETGDTGGF